MSAHVCLCTREANMNTWGAWASSGKGQPHCLLLQQKQKKMLYFISASEIFYTGLKMSVCLFFDQIKWNNQLSISGCKRKHELLKTWCKWVVLMTSPPLCLQRISRFIRRLNYRITLVELQELQNSEGRVLILFYWSSCFFWGRHYVELSYASFPLRGRTNNEKRKKSEQ